jgi:hypothetical protein
MTVVRTEYLPKGMDFVRVVKSMAAAPKWDQQVGFAVRNYGAESVPARILKGSVAGLSSLADDELARWNATAAEFFAVVRPLLILGRLESVRRVPPKVRLISATTGATGYWVGEGAAVPVSDTAYGESALELLKVAALIVATDELLSSSDPVAELTLRNDLIAALVKTIDQSFIDPSNGGTPGVEPASVTYGLSGIASTGDADDDIAKILAAFDGDLSQAYFIGSPLTFATMNGFSRPDIGARGGTIAGIPAIASEAAADSLVLLDGSAVALAEGSADVKVSRQATIQMADDPTNSSATPTPTTATSLWQTNSVGVMAVRDISWKRVRSGAAIVTNIAYVAGVS